MKSSFRSRLFRWFIVVSVIPSILIGGFSYLQIHREIERDAERLITNINDGIYNMIDTQQRVLNQWLPSAAESFLAELDSLGESRFDYTEMVQCGDYLLPTWYIGDQKITHDYTLVDRLTEKEKLPASIFMLVDNKFVRVSTNVRQADGSRIVDTDRIEDQVYERLINGQVYLGRANVEGIMHATIYQPIFDKDGKLIGAFVLGRREQEYELINAIKRIVIGTEGYVMIVDSDGDVILHPNMTGENVSEYEWIEQIIKKQNGSIEYQFEGENKIAYYTYFEPWDWYIVSIGIVDDIFNTSQTMSRTLMLTILASVIISMLISYTISREFLRPINGLMDSLKKLKNGDLSARFTSTSDEEFVFLSNTFNSMSYTLSLLIGRIISTSYKLKDSSKKLLSDLTRSEKTLETIEKQVELFLQVDQPEMDKQAVSLNKSAEIRREIRQIKQHLPKLIDGEDDRFIRMINSMDALERLCMDLFENNEENERIQKKFNYLYVEVQKLKLLLNNIHDSAASLDDIATEVDKQANIFKTENDPYNG